MLAGPAPLDCICNGGFRPFSRFASGHLPYSVDLLRPALCLPLRISLRNLVYEVISTSDGCLIFLEGTRRRRGCAEAGGWGRGNILLAELQIHSIGLSRAFTSCSRPSSAVEASVARPLSSEVTMWHRGDGACYIDQDILALIVEKVRISPGGPVIISKSPSL